MVILIWKINFAPHFLSTRRLFFTGPLCLRPSSSSCVHHHLSARRCLQLPSSRWPPSSLWEAKKSPRHRPTVSPPRLPVSSPLHFSFQSKQPPLMAVGLASAERLPPSSFAPIKESHTSPIFPATICPTQFRLPVLLSATRRMSFATAV
jgi:hypothetical protein